MDSATEETTIASLQNLGATVKCGKSGRALVVDFRPIANKITDDDLSVLSQLSNVREIYLEGASVTDEGLKHLQPRSKLTTLDLQQTDVTDSGLTILKEIKSLKLLLLTGSQVTQDGVKEIRKSMLNTRIVFFDHIAQSPTEVESRINAFTRVRSNHSKDRR